MHETSTLLRMIGDPGLPCWGAEPFLKKVTDIVPSIIYIFNQETQSNEYTNRSLGESLGYSAQDVLNMGSDLIVKLTHPGDLEKMGAHFARILELEDGEVAQLEYRMKNKVGEWVWLLSYDTVFDRDADGRVLRHIGVASDITQLKRAEEEARAAQRRSEAVNDELRTFSYSVSHDLKSPSNTLGLLMQELMDTHGDALPSDAKYLVQMALDTTGRMGRLVDDVLHYTRVINQELKMQPVDLEQIALETETDLRSLIEENGAHLEIDDLPIVRGDPSQLRIYLQNLVENAIKFRKPDVPSIVRLSACPAMQENCCLFSVIDNGVGIDPVRHEQVFQMFKRLQTPTEVSGTGLGLAICRRIAANHGSGITLQSSPGEGATFSMEVPLA